MVWKGVGLFLLEALLTMIKIIILGIATTYLISAFKGTSFNWDYEKIFLVGLAIDILIDLGITTIKED